MCSMPAAFPLTMGSDSPRFGSQAHTERTSVILIFTNAHSQIPASKLESKILVYIGNNKILGKKIWLQKAYVSAPPHCSWNNLTASHRNPSPQLASQPPVSPFRIHTVHCVTCLVHRGSNLWNQVCLLINQHTTYTASPLAASLLPNCDAGMLPSSAGSTAEVP